MIRANAEFYEVLIYVLLQWLTMFTPLGGIRSVCLCCSSPVKVCKEDAHLVKRVMSGMQADQGDG